MIKRGKPTKTGQVKLTFALPKGSDPVSVVGNFNEWNPYAHPLVDRSNGTRSVTVDVPAGSTVHFRYLGHDGYWFDDETADHHDHQGGRIHT
ncbi:isoamylase early set domain-containing protein [Allonocardiopsis opalescens]|uniref:AMP-activated protein kinase-like protein n=1 Tax=Allonocardiopsis opalescens TaxID=1144618 RepID=A0A2T0PXM0_9ACTN|nr:isoamylase early set domain-containing protein [Allonocardiopsis opalescens]PRX96285.1 hypothetical protein CLV72_108292 [Allonocardiopsis opalescens]